MSDKDMENNTVKDGELEAVNGGLTIKHDNSMFTGAYMCECGSTDFKVVAVNNYANKVQLECKKCGRYCAVDNN